METSTVVNATGALPLYVGGRWQTSASAEHLEVRNPATLEVLARVPAGSPADVDAAVRAAAEAFPAWRATPPGERVQPLFRLKALLDEHSDEIARLIVQENGKTLAEARGELRRAVENVEVACGIPVLMQGHVLEDIAAGVDEAMYRQPLGVVAAVTPFNFPAMIPFWFLPYAVACGNTFVIKPSERVPLTCQRLVALCEEAGLPAGVVNLVHGAKTAVDALLDHPEVRAISFVGSTPVARYLYARAAANGKRVQAQGGAKNHVLVLPDADMEMATRVVADSAFGCAGQRCLAVSVAVTIGDARKAFRDRVSEAAGAIRTGYGLNEGVDMGPVITPESKQRIHGLIRQALGEGADLTLDGRQAADLGPGNFVKPTVMDGVPPESALSASEIFGPVLSLVHAESVKQGLELIARSPFGNAASIFTRDGAAARTFRYAAQAGNVGINIGVPAPVASFPFSGWKQSFFGTVHAQGRDAVEFYTEKKVVVERWAEGSSKMF